MKRRLLYRPDSGVSVVVPAAKGKLENEIEQDWLDRVYAKANPDNFPFDDIEDTELPSRRFRNQWVKEGNKAGVDLVKAKEQVLSELRTERDKELTVTDGQIVKENEIGNANSQNAVKTYRQSLRDLPANTNLDAITTAEELETQYPSGLSIADYLSKV